MKIYIGSDHRGYKLKTKLIESKKFDFINIGTNDEKTFDYPDVVLSLSKKMDFSKDLAILICGSGVGMNIAANKIKGVRALLGTSPAQIKISKQHNNINTITFSEKTKLNHAIKMINTWLENTYSNDERHDRRLKKVSNLECNN